MGKCETATASIGIKILLADILSQMNVSNFELIMEMLNVGFIEDENEFFNETFNEMLYICEEEFSGWSEIKENLIDEFSKTGSLEKNKTNNKVKYTKTFGRLIDKYLLVPVKNILSTDRWGYDRYGTNGSSRSINFDLSLDTDKYNEITDYEIVFILSQHSG